MAADTSTPGAKSEGIRARKHRGVAFRHVDVFADAPYGGNGLIVVFCRAADYSAEQLRAVTAEMRQFETIFVDAPSRRRSVAARIFTVEEELPFAGHPVIGAAAALHERLAPDTSTVQWAFAIQGRSVPVVSRRDDAFVSATMDQGPPSFESSVPDRTRDEFAAALNLTPDDLWPLPLQVVSTGLPYLIVPVTSAGLVRARITTSDFEAQLSALGAKFVYVLDPEQLEGRTWDNSGAVEDVATGSAAGPAVAYLHSHEVVDQDRPVHLNQGRFVGRRSSIIVTRRGNGHLWVGGPVRPVAAGHFDAFPSASPEDPRPNAALSPDQP